MTLDQALTVLRRFQDWRRGIDYRPMPDAGIESREVGQAIDVILGHYGLDKPLIDCSKCKYGNTTFGYCRLLDGRVKRKPADKLQCDKLNNKKENKNEQVQDKNL